MPYFFADTRTFVKTYPPTRIVASALKTAIDNIDNSLYATSLLSAGTGATSFQNMVRNGSFEIWERGPTLAPNNWLVTGTGATIIPSLAIVKHGTYSAKLTRVGNDCHLSQNVYPLAGGVYLKSRLVVFGAWVYTAFASRARLRINDGTTTTYSAYHSGSSAWEFLKVSVTTGAGTSALNVGLQIDTGNVAAYLDGAILVEGNTVAQYSPTTPSFNQLPRRATLWHQNSAVVSGNVVANAVLSTQMYNILSGQSPAQNHDTFTQSFWLQRGTYTLRFLGQSGPTKGIVSWELDGVTLPTTHDWYSAALAQNVIKSVVVDIQGNGLHTLTGSVINKTTPSTGYSLAFTKFWLKPASD